MMKVHRSSRGTVSFTLNFDTRWRWIVSLRPQPLYPGRKRAQYPLNRRLGGPQSRPWHFDLDYTDYDGSNTKNYRMLSTHIACALKSCSLKIITTTTWTFYMVLKFYHSLLVWHIFAIPITELHMICYLQNMKFCHFFSTSFMQVINSYKEILHKQIHYTLISHIIMVPIKSLQKTIHIILCMEKDLKMT
jgi:hypothetical protein